MLAEKASGLMVKYGLTYHTALHLARLLDVQPSLRVTSGLRTPARNAAVGGARNSWHLKGRAVDLILPLRNYELHAAGLDSTLRVVRSQRVSPNCTGPEEAFIERRGEPGMHLHVAW